MKQQTEYFHTKTMFDVFGWMAGKMAGCECVFEGVLSLQLEKEDEEGKKMKKNDESKEKLLKIE